MPSNVGSARREERGWSPARGSRDSGASRIAKVHIGRREASNDEGRARPSASVSASEGGRVTGATTVIRLLPKGTFPGIRMFRYVRDRVACSRKTRVPGSFTKHSADGFGRMFQKKAISFSV